MDIFSKPKHVSAQGSRRGSLTFNPALNRNRFNKLLTVLISLFSAFTVLPLFLVLYYVLKQGGRLLSFQLFTQLPPAPGLEGGGIGNALLGTFLVTLIASLIAVPIGVGGGIYLAEYSSQDWFSRYIRLGTNVLAGVPSIISGVFVYGLIITTRFFFGHSFSAMAGGIALAISMLPIVIKTTDEGLMLVHQDLRWGAYGVGASQFSTIFTIVLPAASPAIVTGIILAIARAVGETAPLIFTALFSQYWPDGILNPIASLSVLIYNFSTMPYEAQNELAWAASFILVATILFANLLARWFGSKARDA